MRRKSLKTTSPTGCARSWLRMMLLDLHSFRRRACRLSLWGRRNNDGPLVAVCRTRAGAGGAAGVNRLSKAGCPPMRWVSSGGEGVWPPDRPRHPTEHRHPLRRGTTEYMCAWRLGVDAGVRPARRPTGAGCGVHRHLQHPGASGLSDAPAPEAQPANDCVRCWRCMAIDKMHADDRFVRPFASFDAVKQGEQIGVRHDGAPVLAAEDGCIGQPECPKWGRRFYLGAPEQSPALRAHNPGVARPCSFVHLSAHASQGPASLGFVRDSQPVRHYKNRHPCTGRHGGFLFSAPASMPPARWLRFAAQIGWQQALQRPQYCFRCSAVRLAGVSAKRQRARTCWRPLRTQT